MPSSDMPLRSHAQLCCARASRIDRTRLYSSSRRIEWSVVAAELLRKVVDIAPMIEVLSKAVACRLHRRRYPSTA